MCRGGRAASMQAAGCLLDNLLAARDDDGRGMSDLRLRDELMTLLVAGQETCAPLSLMLEYLFGSHPVIAAAALNRCVTSLVQHSCRPQYLLDNSEHAA